MLGHKLVGAIALTAMLGACATPVTWNRAGASVQDFHTDKYACQKDAIALGGAYVVYGSVSRVPDAGVYHNCMVARGWRATRAG